MKYSFALLCLMMSLGALAQDHRDAEFLATMRYMEHADRIDCESRSGTNMEHRSEELDNLRYLPH